MREVTGNLTPNLETHFDSRSISDSEPYRVDTYKELVEHIAGLSYRNMNHLLFFRGQDRDYKSKSGSSTIYPTIYRGDYLSQREINYRFDILREASRQLVELFSKQDIEGHQELRRKTFIQWSILQHYGVCSTPLVDLTQSLRVACSFALNDSDAPEGYVMVFALPYITNRISINSERDLVLVRLLSICPPSALRPYFQEGFLSGTTDITNLYESKTELDFKNILISKFLIQNSSRFWGDDFYAIPHGFLYPRDDKIEFLCKSIELKIKDELMPGQLGEFMKAWTDLEEFLITISKESEPDIFTLRNATRWLVDHEIFDDWRILGFSELRKFRNKVVHEPTAISPGELDKYTSKIQEFRSSIENLWSKYKAS